VAAFQQLTRTVPIVFVGVVDPVGAGFVARLARPGGNTTGFALFGINGKWLALWHRVDADRCARDNPYGDILKENEGTAFSLPRDAKVWEKVQNQFDRNLGLIRKVRLK